MNTEVYKTPESGLLNNGNSKSDLAHPAKRFQGQFIDGLITIILFAICIFLSKKLNLDSSLESLFILLPAGGYFLFADALPGGQSLAKRLLKISVVHKETRKHCTLWQSFLRNGITPILGIFDAVMILMDGHQRVGDHLARTIVIKK